MKKKAERVHIVMPEYLKSQVVQLANERNISMAAIINDAVKEYLKRESKTKMDTD